MAEEVAATRARRGERRRGGAAAAGVEAGGDERQVYGLEARVFGGDTCSPPSDAIGRLVLRVGIGYPQQHPQR